MSQSDFNFKSMSLSTIPPQLSFDLWSSPAYIHPARLMKPSCCGNILLSIQTSARAWGALLKCLQAYHPKLLQEGPWEYPELDLPGELGSHVEREPLFRLECSWAVVTLSQWAPSIFFFLKPHLTACWVAHLSEQKAPEHLEHRLWIRHGMCGSSKKPTKDGLHVEASLGKTLNPTLPIDVSIGVWMCVWMVRKHVVMYRHKTCCMSVCEWVNLACSVRSTLSGQLD